MKAVARTGHRLFLSRLMKLFRLIPLFLLVAAADAQSVELTALGPFGGDVRSLAQHPDKPERIYLGTADGQIYVSRNRGENWEQLSPGLGRRDAVVDNLVFDPGDPDVLYAAGWELKSSRGWLYRTEDGGENWEAIDLEGFNSSVRAFAIAPSNSDYLAAGISEGVMLSTDRGETWDRISRGYRSLHNVHSLTFDPFDYRRLYVGTWRLGWRTDDLGENWTAIHSGMYWDSDIFTLLVDPRDTETVYASACSGVWKSNSGGNGWTKLKNGLPGEAKRTRTLRFDPSNPDTLYAGTTEGLYRSRDAGASWANLIPRLTINAVLIDPDDSRRLLVGTDDGGILLSRDGGDTFQPANDGFVHRQISSIAYSSNPDRIFTAVLMDGHLGGFFYSQDKGQSWTRYNEGLGDQISVIRSIHPSTDSSDVLLVTRSQIFHGIPGERAWQPLEGVTLAAINDVEVIGPSGNRLLIAGPGGIVSYDRKSQKQEAVTIAVYDREVFSLDRDPRSGALYAGTEMGVFRSDDGGSNWTIKVEGFPYTAVRLLESVSGVLFAATARGLFRSDNGGDSWTRCEGILPLELAAIAGQGQQVFVADELAGYLFSSRDGGRSFSAENLHQRASRISSLALPPDSRRLIVGTLSEGVLALEPSEKVAPAQGTNR